MSDMRIRRGNASRPNPGKPAAGSRPRGPGRAVVVRKGALVKLADILPISYPTLERIVLWGGAAVLAAILWGVASFFGLPGMAKMEAAEWAARAGFQVQKVEVHGTQRMDETAVYNIALGAKDRSMLSLDLPAMRVRIMQLSWVKDARLSRRLPDTLVVDIVEREPVAVWQHGGRLALIDMTGAVLDAIDPSAMPDLPLVVGPRANLQTANLTRLLDNTPALKPVVAGATWVGNRRWDLRFQSGETLSLPEGEREATAALVNFARMDGINRLLGRGIVRFDMRDPDKFVLGMPQKDAGAPEDAANASAGEGDNSSDGAAAGEGDKATALTAPDGMRAPAMIKDA